MSNPDDDTKVPATPSMAAVSVKLPPFWPNDPAVWFAQIEAQFDTRGITSQSTKYYYVVASLQPEIAEVLRDLLLQPPTKDEYDTIKAELITRTSTSEQRRLHQLLISEELGDRKPSQLLRRMKQLLGERSLEASIFRTLFLQRLPTTVQSILATSDGVGIEQLALIADKIMEVSTGPSVQAVSQPKPVESTTQTSEVGELRAMVAKLSTQVGSLAQQLSDRGRSPSRGGASGGFGRGRPRSRSSSRRREYNENCGMCWYHWCFADKAKKCNKPCNYKQQQNTQIQSNTEASG